MMFYLICGLLVTYLHNVMAVAFVLQTVILAEISIAALIFSLFVATDEFAGSSSVKNWKKTEICVCVASSYLC